MQVTLEALYNKEFKAAFASLSHDHDGALRSFNFEKLLKENGFDIIVAKDETSILKCLPSIQKRTSRETKSPDTNPQH